MNVIYKKKAIVALLPLLFIFFKRFFLLLGGLVARRRAAEMYCTIPSVKQSFSASIPLFSFSINILSFFLFLHTSDTWRQIRCRILFEAPEKNFANRSGVKSYYTAMIQIDMNQDFELLLRRGGCFFSWLFSCFTAALEPYRGGTIITHFIPSKVSPSIKPTMK